MCGIIGYIGDKQASDVVLGGLTALEYRGYDSVGLAYLNASGQGHVIKQSGRVENLIPIVKDKVPACHIAIGHTRWATHGLPNSINAHPHANNAQDIFVVHNGIIENYQELREQLIKQGYSFKSETDTEVIPNLIDYYAGRLGNFEDGLKAALNDLKGAFAIALITSRKPETIYAARLSSPLVIGVGKTKEHILASDPNAILEHTKDVVFLLDYDLAIIRSGKLEIENFHLSSKRQPTIELLDYDTQQAALGSFPNFMLKEIFEAPQTIQSATLGRVLASEGIIKLGGLETINSQLGYIDRWVSLLQ